MRIPKLLVLSAVMTIGWAGTASAMDAPHDPSVAGGPAECQSCHKLHSSTGGTMLGTYNSNNDACLTCHGSGTTDNNIFANGWSTGREASVLTPGTGDQHNWSAVPTGAGAQRPADASMLAYLPSDTTKLQCAVCHDVHGKRDATGSIQKTLAPNSAHASYKIGVPKNPILGSGLQLTLLNVAVGARPAGYWIKTVSTTQLQISHDNGATWTANMPYTVGASSTTNLDDGSLVQVRFTGAGTANLEWKFYVSYPFLRTANDLDQMCVDCHRDRDMTHTCVEGSTCTANGTTVFSHPVKEAMGVAGGSTVAEAAILDADGTVGSSLTDGLEGGVAVPNPSNNLKLVGGQVRCTTCHAPHNADSNSLSVDVR